MGFHTIDATQSIEEQQRQMRQIVMDQLGDSTTVLRTPLGDQNGYPRAAAVL